MTHTRKTQRRVRRGEGPVLSFLLGSARTGFLRGVRAVLVVGWVLLLIGVAPTVYRSAIRIANTPSGPDRDAQVSDLIGLVIVATLAPAFALAVLGYGVVPRSLNAELGIGPAASALPIEEKRKKGMRRG